MGLKLDIFGIIQANDKTWTKMQDTRQKIAHPYMITLTSKHQIQTVAVQLSAFKSAVAQPGNLFRPWPTPPQPTPSNGGHKAKPQDSPVG